METIDCVAKERTWIGYMLLHLVGDKYKEIITPETKGVMQVELKLNGVEVEFSKVIDLLTNAFENAVKEKAIELLNDKLGEIQSTIYRLAEHVEDVAINKLGVYKSEY